MAKLILPRDRRSTSHRNKLAPGDLVTWNKKPASGLGTTINGNNTASVVPTYFLGNWHQAHH